MTAPFYSILDKSGGNCIIADNKKPPKVDLSGASPFRDEIYA
jgi:hypothetical protein